MPYLKVNKFDVISELSCNTCGKDFGLCKGYLRCDNCDGIFHSSCKKLFGANLVTAASVATWYCCIECKNLSCDASQKDDIVHESDKLEDDLTALVSSDLSDMNFVKAALSRLISMLLEVHKSQNFLSKKYEDIHASFQQCLNENKDLKQRINKLEEDNQVIYKRLYDLQINNGTHNSDNAIIISGLPVSSDLTQQVVTVFKNIEFAVPVDGIVECNKMMTKSEKNLIVVKLKSAELKHKLFECKKNKKTISTTDLNLPEGRKVYIREFVPKSKMVLYTECQQFKLHHNWKYCWYRGNTVLLKKDDNSKPVFINSFFDFDKLKLSVKSNK